MGIVEMAFVQRKRQLARLSVDASRLADRLAAHESRRQIQHAGFAIPYELLPFAAAPAGPEGIKPVGRRIHRQRGRRIAAASHQRRRRTENPLPTGVAGGDILGLLNFSGRRKRNHAGEGVAGAGHSEKNQLVCCVIGNPGTGKFVDA